jgi:hypothetical protein
MLSQAVLALLPKLKQKLHRGLTPTNLTDLKAQYDRRGIVHYSLLHHGKHITGTVRSHPEVNALIKRYRWSQISDFTIVEGGLGEENIRELRRRQEGETWVAYELMIDGEADAGATLLASQITVLVDYLKDKTVTNFRFAARPQGFDWKLILRKAELKE